MQKNKHETIKPLFHGVILVAGGAIGAGMFALPLVSAGAWFIWSVAAMAIVCGFTYLAANLLTEVNLHFPENSSFDTIVNSILGPNWALLNNISIAFIMSILMYAYITSGGGILSSSIDLGIDIPRIILSLIFALIAAAIVCMNTSYISRISAILMVGMAISFVTANTGLVSSANVESLFKDVDIERLPFIAFAIPVYVTAFACAGLVPTLVSHYYQKPTLVFRSLAYGSLLTLSVYCIWLLLIFANTEREAFTSISQNGGGIDALVNLLQSGLSSHKIKTALNWFSHLAIITSFLAIAVGLVHFLQDKFNLSDDFKGRIKSVGMAFILPTILSMLWPYGFVSAIGYAGLFVAFSFFIVPALLFTKQNSALNLNQKIKWLSVLLFGLLIVVLKLASLASALPIFGS